jgi:hypothetical protein
MWHDLLVVDFAGLLAALLIAFVLSLLFGAWRRRRSA